MIDFKTDEEFRGNVFGQEIAAQLRKAALRADALVARGANSARLVDAPAQFVDAFQPADFGGDQPEHGDLALRHKPQRFETAGALGVILQQTGVDV